MSTPKPNIYLLFGIIFFIIIWLFVGIYEDDEFYELNMFIKYRPTFKVNFYSPRGMSDLELSDLSPDEQEEQIAFQKFIIKQNVQISNDAKSIYLPFILIQLTLTFFCFGILKLRRNILYKKWQLPAHFLICLLPTFTITFVLFFDKLIIEILLLPLLLFVNYLILFLLARRNKKLA